MAKEALAITDRIEGYQREGGNNLYLRKETLVKLAGGEEVAAWVYDFANPEKIPDHPHLTVDGRDGLPVYEWR